MPRFSIIVPAFQVAAYIEECLDSILGQSFSDFEVLAVDDGSTDDTGHLIDMYAKADSRITALHLMENHGTGHARNLGMDQATGDYLVFVDSDDVVPPDAFRSIDERLRATGEPDLLIFASASLGPVGGPEPMHYPDGVLDAADGVFDLSRNPEIIKIPFAPWNKAYRREYVAGKGYRFPAGYYEDIPWSCKNLLTAPRIGLTRAVCLHYRTDRPGSITSAADDRHLDIFTQYRRIFEFIDARPQLAKWRRLILEVSLMGLQTQIARLPSASMPEFQRRCVEHFSGNPVMLADMLSRIRLSGVR